MSESVRPSLPAAPTDDFAFRTSAEQRLVIREAARLTGWSVRDYVLSAALDRAERDLHEHAARTDPAPPPGHASGEPFIAALLAMG
ncbi:type II toxin -antitoxin system TacA 1-like antitoxin [Actinomadura fibrosa]|uniref:DUF1778 domain-containing protein n=1 Tax=Actinomadura fibrosa TaxID=111802 RepID=A0ABW2Y0E2_9ACTN|nr:DUF1778 domain-containing protein [Actinomadura fibrosa]